MTKFLKYIEALESLALDDTLLNHERLVLFISGSNHYYTASLSADQLALLDTLSVNGFVGVKSNFPYNQQFHHDGIAPYVTVAQAARSNIVYFYHTLFTKRFHEQLKRHMAPLRQAKEVVFVAKSSGLNVLTKLLSQLSLCDTKITIIALGPVSKERFKPLCASHRLMVLKGDKDHYSKVLDRHPIDCDVACNHYDYESTPDIIDLIFNLVHGNRK
ncbi:hypothetical protein KG090_02905 [Carnobacteriaceae bacterium zg-ZUI240]|nr:hypothetical protein [Carnobacteriaceae bacterium zg-ZUI240]